MNERIRMRASFPAAQHNRSEANSNITPQYNTFCFDKQDLVTNNELDYIAKTYQAINLDKRNVRIVPSGRHLDR